MFVCVCDDVYLHVLFQKVPNDDVPSHDVLQTNYSKISHTMETKTKICMNIKNYLNRDKTRGMMNSLVNFLRSSFCLYL